MRQLFILFLVLAFVGSAYAYELGNQSTVLKSNDHIVQPLSAFGDRQGGDTIDSATIITEIPFTTTGTTISFYDDYDAICTYTGSTSPDVVYSYFPEEDIILSVDLCGSSYDTKTYIYENSATNLVFCNDDFYPSGSECGSWVSKIETAFLYSGQAYHFVIDGYGGDAGEYILNIEEFLPPPPCILDVNDDENEPELVDGYEDSFNGGCNSPDFGTPFQALEGNSYGELTFSGQTGWFFDSRDTDWFMVQIGYQGFIEWTLDAEFETFGFLLSPQNCESVQVEESMTAGPCSPATMSISGTPGDVVWLWVGSTTYTPPVWFVGNEYKYTCDFNGIMGGYVSTEEFTFDALKSLYR